MSSSELQGDIGLLNSDNQRKNLEQTEEKLEKSLRYWQSWFDDYEVLKDELSSIAPTNAPTEINRLRATFTGAQLVPGKDLEEILTQSRTPTQIVNVLDQRVDYVQQNIATLERQLEETKSKLSKLGESSEAPLEDDEALPLLEVLEDLDDEGRVTGSRLQPPGGGKAEAIAEALDKVGLGRGGSAGGDVKQIADAFKAAMEKMNKDVSKPEDESANLETRSPKHDESETCECPSLKPTLPAKQSPTQRSADIRAERKRVSFAEDTKPANDGVNPEPARDQEYPLEIDRQSRERFARVECIMPEESPEDAFLRREMIKYAKGDVSELGSIVGQMTIDQVDDLPDTEEQEDEGYGEAEHDFEDEDEDERYSGDEWYSDFEDENEWGMSVKSNLTPDYISRMREIEQRLAAQAAATPGSKPVAMAVPSLDAKPFLHATPPPSAPASKSVRFAPELDIAPDSPPVESQNLQRMSSSFVRPVEDVITERSQASRALVASTGSSASRARKPVSNFKKLRSATSENPALEVDSSVVEGVIVENVPSGRPRPPNSLDQQSLQREVALAYSHDRITRMNREGGFLKHREAAIEPLDEEWGGPPKVSLFKSARQFKP